MSDPVRLLLEANDVARLLKLVREKRPRVHTITNSVAQTLTANVLLAAGAIPSMTIAPEEVTAFAASADALLVNLGTLDDTRREAIPLALSAALENHKATVLDPVFADRSPVRLAFAMALLEHRFDLLRVNPDELEALFKSEAEVEGLVDQGTAIALSGMADLALGRKGEYTLCNGDPLLGFTTATGCASGALMAAFLAVERDKALAAAAAISVFNIAGEIAAERSNGPGSLVPHLLDALYTLSDAEIGQRLKSQID